MFLYLEKIMPTDIYFQATQKKNDFLENGEVLQVENTKNKFPKDRILEQRLFIKAILKERCPFNF